MRLRVFMLLLVTGALRAEEADRKAAEFTIAQGGRVKIQGRSEWVRLVTELPPDEYRVEVLDWMGVNADPPDLERLGALRHLKALYLPGPFWNRNADSGRDGSADMKYLAGVTTLEVLTFGDHFLDRIRFRDQGLDAIRTLSGLRELRVRQANVRGPGLRHFAKLESLDIELCPVGDEGFQHLRGMTGLRRLLAGDTLITDAALGAIAGLTQLEELDLHGTAVSDAGLAQLKGLARLRRLNLMGTAVSDAGIEVLAGFRELEELNLYRTKISNTGAARLTSLPKLEGLDLRYSRVTRGGVDGLRKALPRLKIEFAQSSARPEAPGGIDKLPVAEWVQRLGGRVEIESGNIVAVTLARTAVNDAAAERLTALPNLRRLDLSATEVGDIGMRSIAKLSALAELVLNGTAVSDAGLRQLAGLRTLRRLSLRNTYAEGDLDWMPALEELDVSGSPVGNAGLSRIAELPQLKKLALGATDIA